MKYLFILVLVSFMRCVNAQISFELHLNTIDSLVALAEYSKAETYVNGIEKTALSPDQQQFLQNREAQLKIYLAKFAEAESLLNSITPKSGSFLEGVTLTNLGFLRINQARFDLALESLERAHRVFIATNSQRTKENATCLANLALVFTSTGKYNQAKENEIQALEIREQLYGKESQEAAASLNDLGLIYTQLDSDLALDYFERALQIYRTLHGSMHPKIAISNTNIGSVYLKQELFGDAINSFETARDIWLKQYPDGHPNIAQANMQLGQTYSKMKNDGVALEFFQKANIILTAFYKSKHPDIAQSLNQIGLVKLNQRKFDEALQAFHRAIIANAPDFNSDDLLLNPGPKDHYNAKVMLYSIHLKAQAFESRHYGKTLKLADLKVALWNLQLCDSIIDEIRHQSSDESDKLALGDLANEVYEDGVKIAEAISTLTTKTLRYQELAFYFAEKSKSAVLLESIADTQAKSFAGIPNQLIDDERKIKSDIAQLALKLSQKPSAEEERKLRLQLFSLNQQYLDFTKQLEQKYPNYYQLKFNPAIASVAALQKSLDGSSAVVSYFVSERHGRIYQFIITSNALRVKNLTLPDNFDRLIRGFNNSLFYSEWETYQKSARALSKILLPKTSRQNLILIPSGRLGTVPFEALPTNRNYRSYADVHYAIAKHQMSYEFSAGLLLQKVASNKSSHRSIMLCAPVRFNDHQNLGDLPGTVNEVNTIAQLFPGSANVIKEAMATESNLKEKSIANYRYLHFATHGVVDEVNPELSRIFLNRDATEDGSLFSGEIYNLTLTAELAVLSACQTGLGKFSKGEGVIGLSRALTYAGAKNIVVSFWSVNDTSTSQLMSQFYQHLIANEAEDFSGALRKAKLTMISEKKFSLPYYWAPFVLIGK